MPIFSIPQTRSLLTAASGLAFLLGAGRTASAEIPFADNVRINTTLQPTLTLDQSGGLQAPQKWSLGANDAWLFIDDVTNSKQPFSIRTDADDNSLVIDNDGFVGLGTKSPSRNLHVIGRGLAGTAYDVTLRLEVPVSGFQNDTPAQAWDITGNANGLFVYDASSGYKYPFYVKQGTPSQTLAVTSNGEGGGQVGVGTIFPFKVNGKYLGTGPTTTHLNVLSTLGVARSIVEGQSAAETFLVHTGGAANQKMVRTRVTNGLYFLSTVPDTAVGSVEPYAFSVKLSTGNVGIRTGSPAYPLQVGDAGKSNGNGAHVTNGGVWTNASSRSVKQDIEPITSAQARETVRALQPVGYRYKNELDEKYVGFIAEDVPDLVATNDRRSLASMDIVAVLTRVVQDQDRLGEQQQKTIDQQQRTIALQQDLLTQLSKRLTDLEQRTTGRDATSP